MGVPVVETCCCFVSLSTGTLLIGYLYTCAALFEMIVCALVATLASSEDVSPRRMVVLSADAGVSLVQLLCGLLLIVGATRRHPSLMLPWSIVTGLLAAIYVLLCVTGISLVLQDTGEALKKELAMILFRLVTSCVSIYCVIVVHSRHKQIMAEQQERRLVASARLYLPVRTDDPHTI